MRCTLAFTLIFALVVFTVGCTRRVTVEKPGNMQVIVNDRVVDIVSDKSMIEVINKAPTDQQAALIRDWIAAKERLATQVINSEDKKAGGFWDAVKRVIEILAPAAAGYFAARP
jgi:hypothetical protein